MPDISASAVKELRERTGLPMMECKKALAATGGDQEAAVKQLREQGLKTQETRLGRDTSAGRIAVFADVPGKVGSMIELLCESAPVSEQSGVQAVRRGPGEAACDGAGRSHRRRAAQAAVPVKAGAKAQRNQGRHVQPHPRSL